MTEHGVLVDVIRDDVKIVSVNMEPVQVTNFSHYDFNISVRVYAEAIPHVKNLNIAELVKSGVNDAVDAYVEKAKKRLAKKP